MRIFTEASLNTLIGSLEQASKILNINMELNMFNQNLNLINLLLTNIHFNLNI